VDDLLGGLRTGLGLDQHALVQGREFVLGGVRVPFDRGPLGHSDGDALLHALMDAVLGALGEPDIGTLFPARDPSLRGVCSLNAFGACRGTCRSAPSTHLEPRCSAFS